MKTTFFIIVAAIVAGAIFWSNHWALREGVRDEYRGWKKFRRITGLWPFWSIIVSITSIPLFVLAGTYVFIQAAETNRLPVIYAALIVGGFCLGFAWYGMRRLANHLDLLRAQRTANRNVPSSAERFIR